MRRWSDYSLLKAGLIMSLIYFLVIAFIVLIVNIVVQDFFNTFQVYFDLLNYSYGYASWFLDSIMNVLWAIFGVFLFCIVMNIFALVNVNGASSRRDPISKGISIFVGILGLFLILFPFSIIISVLIFVGVSSVRNDYDNRNQLDNYHIDHRKVNRRRRNTLR